MSTNASAAPGQFYGAEQQLEGSAQNLAAVGGAQKSSSSLRAASGQTSENQTQKEGGVSESSIANMELGIRLKTLENDAE